VAPKLQPGERVLYQGHPSWRSTLDFYAKGLGLTAGATLIVAVVTSFGADGANAGLVMIVALVGVALTILTGFVKRVATSYTITDRRLHIRRGIVSRTVQETRLQRVQNVNYRQTLLQRLLRIGDVDFDTAAGQELDFIFSGVAEPADVIHRVGETTGLPRRR
jgi:uncharacterized membrane protein YdbT with pleckstrin-like domain